MRIKKTLTLIVTLCLICSMMMACSSTAKKTSSDTYRFAVMAPLTGDAAQYGITYQNTLEILKDKVNESGGINGKKIEICYSKMQGVNSLIKSFGKEYFRW